VTAFLDANVLIRHLTADPPDAGARATRFLERADALLLPDVIVSEVVYVLESFYQTPREQVATAVRAILAFRAVGVVDANLLLRALELYEVELVDFADAYLVACAEAAGVPDIVSFDRDFDRLHSVNRVEP
jgi:predicted nucleic acid-binding protein